MSHNPPSSLGSSQVLPPGLESDRLLGRGGQWDPLQTPRESRAQHDWRDTWGSKPWELMAPRAETVAAYIDRVLSLLGPG